MRCKPLDELLADYDKAALINLVKQMVTREPDLVRLVELSAIPTRNAPLDLNTFRQQIDYAFQHVDDYYGYGLDPEQIVDRLDPIVDTAKRFGDAGEWINAGRIYALVLDTVIRRYTDFEDYNGDVATVLNACAEQLDTCFQHGSPDPDTRREWLETLFAGYLLDINMGGMDIVAPAEELIVGWATDEEWQWIEERIRAELASYTNSYDSWKREAFVRFLSERLEAQSNDEAVEALILEQGTPEQRTDLLVKQGHYDKAVDIAKNHFSDRVRVCYSLC